MQVQNERPRTSYGPKRNRNMTRDIARQNARNIAMARSKIPLSFIPPRTPATRTGKRRTEAEGEDFYETFLKAQIDELQDKMDEIDYEFASLTRQSVELSSQVKALETETSKHVEAVRNISSNSREYEKLSEEVRSFNQKLSSARSQLTQVVIAKNERLKRLEAYKTELDERKLLLSEHQSKDRSERVARGDRKLNSSVDGR